MKKSVDWNKIGKISLLLGILFLLLSFILFFTLKETGAPTNCVNNCGKFIKYVDAFTPEFKCPSDCQSTTLEMRFTYHNPIYVPFVWLGIVLILLGIVLGYKYKRKHRVWMGQLALLFIIIILFLLFGDSLGISSPVTELGLLLCLILYVTSWILNVLQMRVRKTTLSIVNLIVLLLIPILVIFWIVTSTF